MFSVQSYLTLPSSSAVDGGEGEGEPEHAKKAPRTAYKLTVVPESLQHELEAFAAWRLTNR